MHTIMLYSVYEWYLICLVNESKEITLILKIKRLAICIFNEKYIYIKFKQLKKVNNNLIRVLYCCWRGPRTGRHDSVYNKNKYTSKRVPLLQNKRKEKTSAVTAKQSEQKTEQSGRSQQK